MTTIKGLYNHKYQSIILILEIKHLIVIFTIEY